MMSGKKPDCDACGWTPCLLENVGCVEIVRNYMGTMVDGMGGVKAESIKTVLDMEGYGNDLDLFRRILIYISTYLNARSKSEEK